MCPSLIMRKSHCGVDRLWVHCASVRSKWWRRGSETQIDRTGVESHFTPAPMGGRPVAGTLNIVHTMSVSSNDNACVIAMNGEDRGLDSERVGRRVKKQARERCPPTVDMAKRWDQLPQPYSPDLSYLDQFTSQIQNLLPRFHPHARQDKSIDIVISHCGKSKTSPPVFNLTSVPAYTQLSEQQTPPVGSLGHFLASIDNVHWMPNSGCRPSPGGIDARGCDRRA
jgi:hypothetical protein